MVLANFGQSNKNPRESRTRRKKVTYESQTKIAAAKSTIITLHIRVYYNTIRFDDNKELLNII